MLRGLTFYSSVMQETDISAAHTRTRLRLMPRGACCAASGTASTSGGDSQPSVFMQVTSFSGVLLLLLSKVGSVL